mgnify:CR=1 FL=1
MNFFERHPKLTLSSIVISGVLILLAVAEFSLRLVFGLGNPVLYCSSPLFGYRLQPNQFVHRRGAEIRVNNLGVRADRDWDEQIENKILFLGNSVTYGGTYISPHIKSIKFLFADVLYGSSHDILLNLISFI